MKFLRPALAIFAILLLCFFAYRKLQTNKEVIDQKAELRETVITEIPVTTVAVSRQQLGNELEMVGTFEARKELSVIAETQGRITHLAISEGQQIGRGHLIATIDDATLQSQLVTARASLEKARKDVERYRNLLEAGAISQTQFEEVELGMQNQQTNITAIEQQLQYTRVKSPMNGVVSEIQLEEGSFASPGTPIATVVDISKLNMVVMVDEHEVVKVREGQQVQIKTEVYPDVAFTGRVSQIGVQADAARKYEIAIELDNNSRHPLKAGMYGTAVIPSAEGEEQFVLTVPRKSVVGSLKQPQVYVLENDTARLINVEVGETMGEQVVIRSGLAEGTRVITTGQINLDDGRMVKVVQ